MDTEYLDSISGYLDAELKEWFKMKSACIPRIKELKLKGMTYKAITIQLQKEYPALTESEVSKWGYRELGSMQDYRKNPDGSLVRKRYEIWIDEETMERLTKARERLRDDWGRSYLPSHSETIKDLLDKC
jgi:hypothetical protein